MAQDNSVGGLYIRLGLSLSELETGFITASQTVAANISRLNREADLIRLRAEVEIAGLDEVNDAERILQIRTESLNQRIAIQRDRIRLLSAAYRDVARTQGETSVAAQRAAIRLERERLAFANLERESRNLNSATDETNSTFGGLSDLLPEMPTKLGAVQMAFAAVTAGIGAAGAATKELLNEFRELQNQSYELNMSFPDTRKFLREMRLAGGDIGDYEGYIRGITDAWTKGEWDDPEFIALRKYGAEIVDATGRLKDFKDISEEVYQAWLKADAAGEGIEFLQLTGGESGIRDAIQYFQRLKEAREDAAKIFKAEIDDEQLHKLDRSMNLVTEQASELKAALGDIFVPAAQAAAEKFFNVLHDGTEYLVENKNALQKWYFVAAEVFGTISEKVGDFTDKLADIAKAPKGTTGNSDVDKVISGMGWRYQEFNQQKPFGVNTDWDKFNEASKSYGILNDAVKRGEENYKAFNGELKEATNVSGKVAQGLAALSDAQKKNGDVLSQYGIQRVKEFKDELADLQIELEFGDDNYKKSLAQLDLWLKRELEDKLYVSNEERNAINELYSAKLEQIEQEHSDKIAESIQEHMNNYVDIEYEMTHSAFEKQIRDIERWEQAQREKADTAEEISAIVAEAAAKEAQAFEREVDRIKNLTQSLEDEIFEMENSQYEADKRRALQKAQRALDEGVDFATVQRYLQDKFGQLNKRAAESRTKGGDYTKAPEGAGQFGGNGIMVIGANQIVDNGLIRGQQRQIALLTDENRIRTQLMTKLDESARAEVEKINATKALTEAQADLTQQMSSNAIVNNQYPGVPVVDAPTIIQGDQVTQISNDDAKKIIEEYRRTHPQQALSDYQQMPTEQLQQFGDALQQTTADIQQIDPLQEFKAKLQEVTNTQSAFISGVKDFPPDYFKTLADNAKSVSEMQGLLTRSTMDLIKAQGSLADTLNNLPSVNPAKQTNNNQSLPTDSGFVQLSNSTQNVKQEQDLLARSSREASDNLRQISEIPRQREPVYGIGNTKVGFDWEAFSGISQAGLSATALLSSLGAIAPIPTVKLGAMVLGAAVGGGFAAGGTGQDISATKAMPDINLSALETSLNDIKANVQSLSEKLQVEKVPLEINLSELVTPLSSIDEKTQSILQAIQDQRTQGADRLQELFGTLPNIEELNKSILLEMQEEKEANFAEYLSVVPKISEDVQSILQSLAKPPDVPEAVTKSQMPELPDTITNRQMPELSQDTIDYLSPLNSISGKLDSVIQEMQKPMTFETVVTPLNSITTLVDGISKLLSNRQPPQININPNNNIDLGGAYVFDNALKKQLVDDITSQIVDRITSAVNQATRNASYSYGA